MVKQPVSDMSQPMSLMTSQKTQEWYTPAHVTNWVHAIMGNIELDPASCEAANLRVRAERFYSLEDNGYKQKWFADTLFLNPPYDDVQRWVDKLEFNYAEGRTKQAILLINSAPGYHWYERLWRAHTVCCLRERIHFINGDGLTYDAAKKATTLVYFGLDDSKFASVLAPYGRIIRP